MRFDDLCRESECFFLAIHTAYSILISYTSKCFNFMVCMCISYNYVSTSTILHITNMYVVSLEDNIGSTCMYACSGWGVIVWDLPTLCVSPCVFGDLHMKENPVSCLLLTSSALFGHGGVLKGMCVCLCTSYTWQ